MAGAQVQIKAGVRVQPVAGCNYLNLTDILGPRTSLQAKEAQASSSRSRPSIPAPQWSMSRTALPGAGAERPGLTPRPRSSACPALALPLREVI